MVFNNSNSNNNDDNNNNSSSSSNNKTYIKTTYTWQLNYTLLNDNLLKEKNKEIKGSLEFNENQGTTYKN